MLGIREVDSQHTRIPVIEFGRQNFGEAITTYESAVFDLVDLLPARHYQVFNPAAAPQGSSRLYPSNDGADPTFPPSFPEPRFFAQYFIGCSDSTIPLDRNNTSSQYVEIVFLTSAEVSFPTYTPLSDVTRVLAARIPLVGSQTEIESLVDIGNDLRCGEVQSGCVPIRGRYFKAVVNFSASTLGNPNNLTLGVYLSTIPG